MYERFTDRARKVMQLANQEAQRFNHEYIGTEHILLGLIKEGSGVAAHVLKNLDVDLRTIRLEVEKIVQSGPDIFTMGKLPQTPRAKNVLEYAVEEAHNLGHNYVGTEHLLLGLVREEGGVAAQVLLNLRVQLAEVRQEVLNLLGEPVSVTADERRRQIDPATCERDYTPDEIEFMRAMDQYKRDNRRPFPTYSETLEVLHALGYRKVAAPTPLPGDPMRGALTELIAWIQQLEREKWAAVDAQDFEKAACLRDQMDKLKKKARKLERRRTRRAGKRLEKQEAAVRAAAPAEADRQPDGPPSGPDLLEGEFRKVRFLLGLLTGALTGALIDPPLGAILGAPLGGVVAAFGRVLGGILVGIFPGALLGATYLGGEGGPLAGGAFGALVGGCLGSIGRPFPFWPARQAGRSSIPE